MIIIDGNKYEGGGQIVRTALALSVLTGKDFRINNIRKGRKVPGLKRQHISCIKALQSLCNAKADNTDEGADSVLFVPGKIKGGTIEIDIGTAGSITLLLQSLILPCIFSEKNVRLKIIGGTDVKWSSPIDYFSEVFLPHIRKYAKDIKIQTEKRGYYPKGQGKVDLQIKTLGLNIEEAKKLNKGIKLSKQGKIVIIKGVSHASRDLAEKEVSERQARRAKLILSKYSRVDIRNAYNETESSGSGLVLWARFSDRNGETDFMNPIIIGADSLGEKGKKSEQVAEEAAKSLVKEIESKAAVDSFLADQLIPFIAIFGGEMKVSQITDHTRANIYVCEEFLGKVIEIDEENKIIRSK
jgi:RNA 3'-phosphate cyclase